MKALAKTIKYLIILIVILGAISLLLPQESNVSRSTVITAPPEKVFSYVNSMKQFNKWSPWAELDPNTVMKFSGPESGLGSAMEWSSEDPSVGKGKQVIVAVVDNKLVETSLEFDGQDGAVARWLLEPDSGGTKIEWHFNTQWGYNPIGRYMGLMMDKWVGSAYEDGLVNLKNLVESE
ncbi:MAG: SRPBCC family protein [Acidiferrobacterales bacterium]|nr:SRPBCC family protein [Acidiferrobacterales bacterium]